MQWHRNDVRFPMINLNAGIKAELDLLWMQPLCLGDHMRRHRGTLSIEAPLGSWHLRNLRGCCLRDS